MPSSSTDAARELGRGRREESPALTVAARSIPWALLAAGLAGSAIVDARPWLAAADPLRGTLAMVPAAIGSLAAIARAARNEGARRIPRAITAAQLTLAVLLVALASGRASLGLPYASELIFAGFAGLLFHRTAHQLLALRPLLGPRLPARPSLLFFLLPLTVYCALMPWSTAHRSPDGDEPWYLLLTHSLAYDGDAILTDEYRDSEWRHFMARPIEPQPGDPRGPGGEIYSRHNEALPLLLVPAYRLAGKPGALVMMAALTAALAWTTLRLARRYAPEQPGAALLAYAAVAFTPPLLLYSSQVWVEVPAALLAAAALDRVLAPGGWGWKKWLGVGVPLLLLPLLKIRLLMLAGPLLLMAWLFAGRPRKPLVILGVLLAILGGGILFYNQLHYGNPLKVHSLQEVEFYRQSPLQYYLGVTGFFWDAAFGLFATAPLWMLLLPAAALLLRRRAPLSAHLAAFALPYLVLVAPRSEWYGGWSPPFRYALVTLPLLGVALMPLLAARRPFGARALLAALGALTALVTVVWLTIPGWTYNFADGRTYLLDSLSGHLGADVARLFPSSVRPRLATWIWPVASLLLIPLWFAGRRAGRSRSAAAWGLAALLTAAAALPLAARRLPTSTIEFEDPYVAKSGGHAEPERWTFDRTRFRGVWVLRTGEQLVAPVRAGGAAGTMTLYLRFVRNRPGALRVEVHAGTQPLGELRFADDRSFEERTLAFEGWPAGAPLVVTVAAEVGSGEARMPNGVLLDRAEFQWR